MAKSSGQANPWSIRVAIFGLICIFIGSVMLFGQSDAIDNAFSPRNVSEISLTGDGSEIGELDSSCYVAVGLNDGDYGNISLTKMLGSSPASESLEPSSCPTDWQPMDTSGEEYYFIEEWDVTEEGEYVLKMECLEQNGCKNATIWLVDVSEAQWNIFGEIGLIAAGGMCCFGLIALPVALILYLSNRNKSKVMMINYDGMIMPLSELTPETVSKIENANNLPPVDNPFADTGISKSEDFVDGRESVENGTLLTTDQVFALMKGDVAEAQKRVSDPFADYNEIKVEQSIPKKTSNSKDIAFWDSGDDKQFSSSEAKQVVKDTSNKSPTKANGSQSKTGAWKDWDDL